MSERLDTALRKAMGSLHADWSLVLEADGSGMTVYARGRRGAVITPEQLRCDRIAVSEQIYRLIEAVNQREGGS